MSAMPAVRTTAELYPPEQPEGFARFVNAVITADRDARGNFILWRSLTHEERVRLQARADALAPWLTAPPNDGKIAAAIVGMLMGFGGAAMTRDEAAAKATQYVAQLRDVPLWAIERACIRFGNGEVRADELDGEPVSLRFGPSTAQLRKIAIALVRPFGEESTRITMTLRGTVRIDLTEEQRAAASEYMAQAVSDIKRRQDTHDLELRERDVRHRAHLDQLRKDSEAHVRAEYAARGLEIPEDGTLVSLSLRLKMGWTIQEVDGRPTLIKPPPEPERHPDPEMRTRREMPTTARPLSELVPDFDR